MPKPKFDPTQPYQAVTAPVDTDDEYAGAAVPVPAEMKPKFDPTQPYQAVSSKAPQAAPAPSTLQTLEHGAGVTSGVLAKLAGTLRAGSTGPLTGSILEALTGKKAYDASEVAQAFNPTNLNTFPSNAEMAKRTGFPNPALSDAVPGYADPKSKHPWWQPEKGGMLDPTLLGVVQVPTDPAMYVGMGEAAAAAKGLPMVAKGLGVLNNVVNPLSMVAGKAGKSLYESPLLPLEQQGARKGKDAIAQTLYEGGVMTPRDLPTKAQGVIDQLMAKRDGILTKAESAGGVASMEEAVQPLRDKIALIRKSQDPAQQAIADKMEERLNKYLAVEQGTPGVPGSPPTTKTVASPILDESGNPFTSQVEVPGTPDIPGVPPKAVTPLEASGYKSSIYKTQPKGHYNVAGQSDLESELDGLLAQGQLNASQTATGKALGSNAERTVQELNQKAGGLLSTQGAQTTIAERAGRQAAALKEISPGDIITASAGTVAGGAMGHPLEGMVGAYALKKLASAINQSKMPVGFLTRKLGSSTVLDRLNEALKTQNRSQK